MYRVIFSDPQIRTDQPSAMQCKPTRASSSSQVCAHLTYSDLLCSQGSRTRLVSAKGDRRSRASNLGTTHPPLSGTDATLLVASWPVSVPKTARCLRRRPPQDRVFFCFSSSDRVCPSSILPAKELYASTCIRFGRLGNEVIGRLAAAIHTSRAL
jgi:hypothetical protein